jgi:integrase
MRFVTVPLRSLGCTRGGKMREMGLGRARGAEVRGKDGKEKPAFVTLADARSQAADLYRAVCDGRDPLSDKDAAAAAAQAKAQEAVIAARTFRQAAEEYIEANKHGWRNPKHRAQWPASLGTYAYPHFGEMPVRDVATKHVLAALEPIWRTKPETATRLRGRIETVLSAEAVRGNRSGDNPARWRGHLDQILLPRSKIAPIEHHPALPYAEMAALFLRLQAADGLGARALELAILTAARSGEVLGATWGEMDLVAALWTVPAARMKGGREHRVPLSGPALTLLRKMATIRNSNSADALVFPAAKGGGPLSNMVMTATLRRLGRGNVTTHGFRSTFRDWAAEQTDVAGEVAEAALAHAVGDKVEAAYRRGDLFEKRRKLMNEWAAFCGREPTVAADAGRVRHTSQNSAPTA